MVCLVKVLLFFNSIVLMSSGPAGSYGDIKLFQSPITYSVNSIVLLNDVGSSDKEVGYKVKSKLAIDPVWSDSATHFLLKFELDSPKLHVRSRKARHEGFVEHASPLDSYLNSAFFAEWKDGIIRNVYINQKEEPTWVNYKKSLISVFQFQILDQETEETDISGKCEVSYESLSRVVIRKVKYNCIHDDVKQKSSHHILSTVSNNVRMTRYEFSEDLKSVMSIFAEELHELRLGMKQNAGNKIRVWQELNLVDDNRVTAALKAKTLAEALPEVEAQYGFVLKAQGLALNTIKEDAAEGSDNLVNMIKDNRDQLQAENLGTEKSAIVFMKILRAMRLAKTDLILKVLKGVKNKEILPQLLDLVGFSQTYAAHLAAKTFLSMESEYDRDNIERYLWAQSVGPKPDEKVMLDILKLSDNAKLPIHVSETLLLTACAMANRLAEIRNNNNTDLVAYKVKDHVTINLSKCKEAACIVTHLRALQNLKRPDTINILLDHTKKGQRNVAVMALKALRGMPKKFWSKDVIDVCKRVFYQLERAYDSSARTLAVDIMLEAVAPMYEIEEMLDFLASDEKDFEVKQFLLQRLQMMSEKCERTRTNLDYLLKKYMHINNYNVLAQKGLSTALSRTVTSNTWSNVSIVSVQEISGGVLKRGYVDLLIEDSGENKQIFSLGLFAGGLGSMMGSSSEEDSDSEPTTAGMELAVLGVHLRPFTFFSGQGELMGHAFSGTASERTTAFQALMLVQEEEGQSILATGSLARWSLSAAASVDLAGQIQLSLWSRTAHSVVDKGAGIVILGTYNADTPFVKSGVKFTLGVEPKLNLESDIDFYDGVKLCIQVTQPDVVMRHNITKVESIPANNHVMRKGKYKTMVLPGRTYALNRKNNLMCNDIHNQK